MFWIQSALPLLAILLLVLVTTVSIRRQRHSGSVTQLPAAVSAGWLAEFKASTSDRR